MGDPKAIHLELTYDEAGALEAAAQYEPVHMSSEAGNNLASARAKLTNALYKDDTDEAEDPKTINVHLTGENITTETTS